MKKQAQNQEIIEVLNDMLTAELTAINQYFVHAEMCENWGYEDLKEVIRKGAMDEMKHAVDRLNKGIQTCRSASDVGSGMLLEEILKSEEEHVNWLEAQLDLIQ